VLVIIAGNTGTRLPGFSWSSWVYTTRSASSAVQILNSRCATAISLFHRTLRDRGHLAERLSGGAGL